MQHAFHRASVWFQHQLGNSRTFIATAALFALTGWWFDWSAQWSLVVGAATGIASILILEIMQASALREAVETRLLLSEIIRALPEARNELIGVAELDDTRLSEVAAAMPRK